MSGFKQMDFENTWTFWPNKYSLPASNKAKLPAQAVAIEDDP